MSLTMRHPVSGDPVVIENPLLPEHIEMGRALWYSGFTSMGSWDCPAVITQVDLKKRRFRVRSLDDMREQHQEYAFSSEGQPDSRQTMRLTSAEEVSQYLERQREVLASAVERTKAAHETAKDDLRRFDEVRSSLKF